MKTCTLIECEEQIEGRSDKKFCCDNHRSKHNDRINKEFFSQMTVRLNNTKATYKCLQTLYAQSNSVNPIGIDQMYSNKFKQDIFYVLRTDTSDLKAKWFFIEDYGYRQINDKEFLITKIDKK
ncbi:MAG: hypothetical protein WC044_10115 [Crocinitomicaceae bacterium]